MNAIAFASLPEDMQCLLMQFVEDRGIPLPENQEDPRSWPDVPIAVYPVANCYAQVLSWGLDEFDRGRPHIEEMKRATEPLPPIVVIDGDVVDGRHRLYAAHETGQKSIAGIPFTQWLETWP